MTDQLEAGKEEERKSLYRAGMEPMPNTMRRRPIDERGYPVPWFTAVVNGKYDLRVADARKIPKALHQRICWICGQRMGLVATFVVGPMAVMNSVTSEPPSHPDCAEWASRVCPFINQSMRFRNRHEYPEGTRKPAGISMEHQPGIMALWTTNTYSPFRVQNGTLIKVGVPKEVIWVKEGRHATRAEVVEAVDAAHKQMLSEAESLDEITQMRQARQWAEMYFPKK